MSRQEMFREYPDVVNIEQLCEMLGGVSVKAAYQRLLELEGDFASPKRM